MAEIEDIERDPTVTGTVNQAHADVEEQRGLSTKDEELPALSADEYEVAHGEKLIDTLDLDKWQAGADLVAMYARLEQEVAEAVKLENKFQQIIRKEIFPRLGSRKGRPKGAGVFQATPSQIEDIHSKLLFNGAVEACDGTVVSHDTLPVTITQIGVCLVSYNGDRGAWMHRIFRKDMRTFSGANPVEETLEFLERRRKRGAVDQSSKKDRLSELARRGIMDYAERAVLLAKSDSVWRMGHGPLVTYPLLTGSGMPELLRASLKLMREMIEEHKRFVFVPSSTTARELLTIGSALKPLEYAIVDTNQQSLDRIASGHYRGQEWVELGKSVSDFVNECGPKLVVGLYRASAMAPAQMFYAHVDHAHEAALIAMADSVLQEHRGFPMLIDLADGVCRTTFGADIFAASTQLAYAAAGEPYRYMTERSTRR